jgi:hypothetical protein
MLTEDCEMMRAATDKMVASLGSSVKAVKYALGCAVTKLCCGLPLFLLSIPLETGRSATMKLYRRYLGLVSQERSLTSLLIPNCAAPEALILCDRVSLEPCVELLGKVGSKKEISSLGIQADDS